MLFLAQTGVSISYLALFSVSNYYSVCTTLFVIYAIYYYFAVFVVIGQQWRFCGTGIRCTVLGFSYTTVVSRINLVDCGLYVGFVDNVRI